MASTRMKQHMKTRPPVPIIIIQYYYNSDKVLHYDMSMDGCILLLRGHDAAQLVFNLWYSYTNNEQALYNKV